MLTPSLADQVINVITDAISSLLGMVVVLQEKNAPIPATLPKTGKSVVEACDRLVSVAKELAADEYGDFPDIEKEIVDAASDVGSAADALEQAIRNLQTSKDRQTGWNKLVDSCKVIAEMTVLLLQIVYGAEVKRVFAMQRRAEAQLVAVDVSMVEENRKQFAEIASAAASAAVELADAIRAKAAEQALPVRRDALLQLADALEQQAKDVMDRANELLRLPGDKGRQQKLDDALTKLKKTMKDALVPLQEEYIAALNAQKWTLEGVTPSQVQRLTTDPADRKRAIEQLLEAVRAGDKPRIKEALDRVEWELDNVQNLAKRVMAVRPEASEALEQFNLKRRGLKGEVKEAEADKGKKLEGFWADLMDCQAKLMDEIVPVEDRVMQLVNEQLGDMDRIKRALRNGGDSSVVTTTKNVFGTHKDLMKAAEKCHNGWKKGKPKRMRDCIAGANGIMGGYIKGVQTAVKDADSRPRTYQNSQELALSVEDVCAEALPFEEAVILAGQLQIQDLRAQHEPHRVGWTELQDTIEKRGPRFERLAREAKEAKDEAAARRLKMGKGQLPDSGDVEAELRKLRTVAEQQKEQAQSQGPDWLRVNLRHVEAVQDAVAAALTPKSRLVYLANRALEDLKLGSDADKFARGPGQALSHHVDRVVAECGRVGAGLTDAGARERLKKLADQMDPILEELHAAAAKANRNPNATDAFRDFVKLNHRLGDLTRQVIQEVVLPVGEIQALADRIVKGLDNQLNVIPHGKEGPVTAENTNLEDATDRLAELTEFAARHAGADYAAKHRIRNAGEALRRDQPEHAALSLRAVGAPADKEAMRNVKTVDRRLRLAVEALVGDTATPEAQLAAIARQLIAHVDQLTDGVRDGGDSIDVPTMAGVEGALGKRLAAQVDRVRQNLVDPVVAKQLERAIQDVNELMPFHLASVRDVMTDPEKKEEQQKLTSDAQALKDAVMAVVAAAGSSPEEELRAYRRVARDALQDGVGKAQRGEGAAAEGRGQEAAKRYADVERYAREVGLRTPRGAAVERAAYELRSAADDSADVLRRVAADGGAPESRVACDKTQHAADALTETVARDAAARMKAEAKKMQRDLQAVAAGLQRGEPKEVAARLRSAGERFGELAQLAEAEAKSLGGADEEAMLDVVALLKAGIPALSDAAVTAMGSNWDAAPTAEAVSQAHRLQALAGSLADGSYKNEASAAGSVPSDSRRGERLWNASSPDFVGKDELAAADHLESLLPALGKGNVTEQTLLEAEKDAGRLGRFEPSAAERVARLARLADMDLQYVLDEAAENKDAPAKLTAVLEETAQGLGRGVDALLDALVSKDVKNSVRRAAAGAATAVPDALRAAKSRNVLDMNATGEAAHLTLDAIAEVFDPSPELSLLELRDQAGSALEGLQKPGNTKFTEVDRLANIRIPLQRALAVALRRGNVTDRAVLAKAEELARLWASLPEVTRKGDASDVLSVACRMDELLDELMKSSLAFPVGLAQRIDSDLGKLQVAVRDEDQKSAQTLAQGIVSDLKDLEAAAEQHAQNDAVLAHVKEAKAASIAVIKKVPEVLQGNQPVAALDAASLKLRVPLAQIVAALWKDDASKWRANLAHIGADLASGDADDAIKRAARLGPSREAEGLRVALKNWAARLDDDKALGLAKRRMWVLGRAAPEAVSDPDASIDSARAHLAAEALRTRRGLAPDGTMEAAKRLIAGTRANYKRQNLEGFDFGKLDAAAQKAKARAPRSLADVLAEIRNARQARERARAAAAAPPPEPAKASGSKGGAFSAMQDDINANLKKIVVGSSLDFENERTVQLIRSIATDFGVVGQFAAEKKADQMIEAGRAASKHITELVAELTSLAQQCPDQKAAGELMRSAQVLKDFAVRTKLFTSIKAASLNVRGGDEAMQTFSKELGGSILAVLRVFYEARIKIYEKAKK